MRNPPYGSSGQGDRPMPYQRKPVSPWFLIPECEWQPRIANTIGNPALWMGKSKRQTETQR